jgi:predicted murein hydrolase (TIGR00659 family)
MKDLLQNSVFLGVLLSIGAYAIGMLLKRKTGWSILNPLLVSIVLIIAFLLVTGLPYQTYSEGADIISYMLTPATICLAVPLYQQVELLKKNYKAVLAGILSGVISSMITILVLALLFGFDHASYVTFHPKSITTAIGMGVSQELGGYVSVTVVVIVLTGVIGNVIADRVLGFLHIEEPIAKGVAIGSASHAIGTARAMEMGQVEGAMSGLSIVVSGIMTVLGATVFSWFL